VTARDDLFISDLHLGERTAARQQALERYLRRHARAAARMFNHGDLFTAWIGRNQLRHDYVRRLAEALRACAAGGGPEIHFIAGNRDFYGLRALSRRTGMVTHKRGFAVEAFGRTAWLCHGHELYTHDRRTHTAQAITHSWPVELLFQSLPQRLATFLAEGYQSHSGRAVRYKTARMLTIDDATVCRLFAAGHTDVVCGHTHRLAHTAYRWDGGEGHLWNLGSWDGEPGPHFLRHGADGWHFHRLEANGP
jgi:UDP-2,3-diacylglucosamine hydrolase